MTYGQVAKRENAFNSGSIIKRKTYLICTWVHAMIKGAKVKIRIKEGFYHDRE